MKRVICINDINTWGKIEKGKEYEVLSEVDAGDSCIQYLIKCDLNNAEWFYKIRFKTIEK